MPLKHCIFLAYSDDGNLHRQQVWRGRPQKAGRLSARLNCVAHICFSEPSSCPWQADFEKRVNPNDPAQQALIEELRAHVKKVGSCIV